MKKSQNYKCYFESEIRPQVGDLVATGHFGTCKVLEVEGAEFKVENIMTKETAHLYVSECDLIDRADPYSGLESPVKEAFQKFVKENGIIESAEYGSHFLSSKLAFISGCDAINNDAISALKLYREWNRRVQTDDDSTRSFDERLKILHEAKVLTERVLKSLEK